MISKKVVEEQLKRIGFNFRLWGRAEVNELGRILLDDETIAEAVNGEYTNGFALLVVTNHRVLLVDKKPMLYLTVEDLRFDMITEFNFSHRLTNATINLYTPNKTLTFTSWNQSRLRKLLEYTQQRVLEMRQQAHMSQQFQTAAAAQYAQLHAANYYQPETPAYVPNQAVQQPEPEPQIQAAVTPPLPQYEPAALAAPAVPTPEPTVYNAYPEPTPTQHVVSRPEWLEQVTSYPSYEQATAPEPVAEPAPQPQPTHLISRLAARRAALGTYTRSKLPSLHLHHNAQVNETPAAPLQPGVAYPPAQTPANFGGMPFEVLGE